MPKKVVKGTTENLNILNNKVDYIGFTLGKVPDFINEFEPLNYRVPKVYDETTYKIYKYIPIEDIEIMITPTNRLEELEKRYKYASPLFTYMKAETNENIEKYAQFLKMINQTKIEDIDNITEEQDKMAEKIPFEVKFPGNFKWQIYYSDYADKYFMLASTEESDNSPLFYLLKNKIIENKDKRKKKKKIFVPISNEGYTEKILKKSEISDLENYLWYFTKNWPSIYEVTDKDGNTSLQIVGDTPVYDQIITKYNITYTNRKDAIKGYKLIKALFILAYDIKHEFEFKTKINEKGQLIFLHDSKEINYDNLSEFIKEQAIDKKSEDVKIKIETRELKADIKELQKKCEELKEEYQNKEKQIYIFLECKKTFFGKVKYFFKSKKNKQVDINSTAINKERLKDILNQDKDESKLYTESNENDKLYTVEDMIKICNELNDDLKENKNIKLDIKALKNKLENLQRKIKNATQYLDEIEKHKKSIFEFWKFANKDEVKALNEGEEEEKNEKGIIRKTFNYEDDIDTLATQIDLKQREKLSEEEFNATYAASFVLDGINIMSKEKILKSDEQKIEKILENLKQEYKNNLDSMEKKDFDIFGNVAEDKTKVKILNNNAHRENEKDKFKILNVNLNTQLEDFMEKLNEIKTILKEESNKIKIPYNISVYKASTEKLDTDGFDKFNINPHKTLEEIQSDCKNDEVYLYKINIPENTNIIFYTNIMFYENNNKTLPLGMDISQETLINMDLYDLKLKQKDEFYINICTEEFSAIAKKVKVYEYDINQKKDAIVK